MNHIDLETITLARGWHVSREDGICLLEAVAWWAGESHTDHPKCVDRVIAAYGRRLNDLMPRDQRQRLKQYVPLLAGTATADRTVRVRRAFLCADRAVRVFAPKALRAAGMADEAKRLEALSPVVSAETAREASAAARAAAAAAWDVARAAGAVAGNAAYAAADAVANVAQSASPAAADTAAYAAAAGASGIWDEAIRLLDDLIAVGREEGQR